MLAIKDSAQDMSPYVRKTAAHAIPKLYNLDPEQKEELIGVIEKLLSDRTTLVVGSAVMAFEEVSDGHNAATRQQLYSRFVFRSVLRESSSFIRTIESFAIFWSMWTSGDKF